MSSTDQSSLNPSGSTTPAASAPVARTEPRVSIVIPTHERIGHLCRLLQDLEGQTYPRELLEVLVVDDASPTDPGPAVQALQLRLPLTLLRVPHGGPAKARNRALEKVTGDLVLFLNDDVRVPPNLVEAHVQSHQRFGMPVAVLGTFSFIEPLRLDLFHRVLEDFGFTHTLQLTAGQLYNYQSFWTGNLSAPRAAIAAVHGFDEDFDEASHDDLDLGLRLERALSLKVYFCDAAISRHDHPHDLTMWRRRNRMVGRNILRMHLKHGTNDLNLFKVDGRFSREKVRLGLEELAQDLAVIDQLEGLMRMVLERSHGGAVEGLVNLDGQSFSLPEHTEALLAACLRRLTHHDQLEGLLEAALKLPDLVA